MSSLKYGYIAHMDAVHVVYPSIFRYCTKTSQLSIAVH